MQRRGSRLLVSCGPLLKKPGIIKTPPAQNYLHGDVVQFSCKPDWFLRPYSSRLVMGDGKRGGCRFIHGETERRCINGTWTPGWWAWCRDRDLEYALKWVTGICVILLVVLIVTAIFCCCWRRRLRLEEERGYEAREVKQPLREPPPLREPFSDRPPITAGFRPAPPDYNGATNGHSGEP